MHDALAYQPEIKPGSGPSPSIFIEFG